MQNRSSANASDGTEKTSQQSTLLEKVQNYCAEVYDRIRGCKPRSAKPWILIPVLVYSIFALLWVVFFGAINLIWAAIATTLITMSTCLARTLPGRFVPYLNQFNWLDIAFKLCSRALLGVYFFLAIAICRGFLWGPGGYWPASPVKDVTLVESNGDG